VVDENLETFAPTVPQGMNIKALASSRAWPHCPAATSRSCSGQVDVHRPGPADPRRADRGIDVGSKYEIYEIINRLADSGRGVLMISSELPSSGLCDRIYTLSGRRDHRRGSREQADQETLMRYMPKQEPEKGGPAMSQETSAPDAPTSSSPRRGRQWAATFGSTDDRGPAVARCPLPGAD